MSDQDYPLMRNRAAEIDPTWGSYQIGVECLNALARIKALEAELADVKAMSGYQYSLGHDDGYRACAEAVSTRGVW